MSSEEESGAATGEVAAPRIEEIVKMFMDDCAQREKEAQKQIETMQHHMEQLMWLVEGTHTTPTSRPGADGGTTVTRVVQKEAELKLTKLTDADDFEAYLTTFKWEHMRSRRPSWPSDWPPS